MNVAQRPPFSHAPPNTPEKTDLNSNLHRSLQLCGLASHKPRARTTTDHPAEVAPRLIEDWPFAIIVSLFSAGLKHCMNPRRALGALRQATGILQQSLQSPGFVECHHATQATIVAPTKELATNIEGRDRCTARELGKLGAEGIARLNLVEFDHGVLSSVPIQHLLRLDTERSGGEGKHHSGLTDQCIELRFDGRLIVATSLHLCQTFLELRGRAGLNGFLQLVDRLNDW